MAPKKHLFHGWRGEPGRSIAAQIGQILLENAEVMRILGQKAFDATGLYKIPIDWLPRFDTKAIFDLLHELPYRDEVPNGRDLRGIPSIGGSEGWDFSETDFSYLLGEEGYSFECNL